MVRPDRFERSTYGFEARRSIQLSYGRTPLPAYVYLSPRSMSYPIAPRSAAAARRQPAAGVAVRRGRRGESTLGYLSRRHAAVSGPNAAHHLDATGSCTRAANSNLFAAAPTEPPSGARALSNERAAKRQACWAGLGLGGHNRALSLLLARSSQSLALPCPSRQAGCRLAHGPAVQPGLGLHSRPASGPPTTAALWLLLSSPASPRAQTCSKTRLRSARAKSGA